MMFIKGDDEFIFYFGSNDSMPLLCDFFDIDNVEYAINGTFLVVKHALSMQVKEDILDRRDNIFDSRCLVGAKVCILIIDEKSSTITYSHHFSYIEALLFLTSC